jgi:uncharacterized membrane protein YhaH (DUF805 family)
MSIQESVSTCFSKYATFQGRAPRSEYWWWALFCVIVTAILLGLGAALMGDSSIPWIVFSLFMLAIILPSLAVTVRRLHDSDHSGWWYFIQLVPAIGGLWFLYFMVIGGSPGPNRFGN